MKKLKAIAAITAAALVAGATGCAKNTNIQNTGEGSTFTYWCSMPAAIVSHYQSMNEMSMYQELEKQTGIHIQFTHPAAGQETEQFNLLIASRELPDLLEWDWGNYPGGAEKALDDNIIIKLNGIMKDSAPNLTKTLAENPAYDKLSKTDNGSYYGFPSINEGKFNTFGGLLIRKDWLDELDLPIPETLDEWENTLRAFKEKKGAAAPFTGSAGSLFNIFSTYIAFNNAFNVGKGIYVENGKVKFGPLEDGYKNWLVMMNRWYKDGLLDNNYSTNSSSIIDAKMTNGRRH